jgi:hypothetical protein
MAPVKPKISSPNNPCCMLPIPLILQVCNEALLQEHYRREKKEQIRPMLHKRQDSKSDNYCENNPAALVTYNVVHPNWH